MEDCWIPGDKTVNLTVLFGLSSLSDAQLHIYHNQERNVTECVTNDNKFEYGLEPGVQISLLCFYFISLVLAVGGNITILYIIIKLLSRSTTKTFICSLCLSDIVLFLVCVPVTVISDLIYMYWPFWTFLCPVVTFLQVATVVQRALTLLVLTLDKQYVAARPLRRRLTHKSAKIVILCIWIISTVTAAPSAMYSTVVYLPFEPGSNGLCTEMWPDHASQTKYSYTLLAVQYILPVLVMGCSYSHIAGIIWAKTPPGEKMFHRDKRLAKTKRKTVKMLMVVVIAYVVCWLPLHILTLIGEKDPSIFDNHKVHCLWLLSHWLATSNSAVNPLVYFWMNPAYRAGVRIILSRLRGGGGGGRSTSVRNYAQAVRFMMPTNAALLSLTLHRTDSNLYGRDPSTPESSIRQYKGTVIGVKSYSPLSAVTN